MADEKSELSPTEEAPMDESDEETSAASETEEKTVEEVGIEGETRPEAGTPESVEETVAVESSTEADADPGAEAPDGEVTEPATAAGTDEDVEVDEVGETPEASADEAETEEEPSDVAEDENEAEVVEEVRSIEDTEIEGETEPEAGTPEAVEEEVAVESSTEADSAAGAEPPDGEVAEPATSAGADEGIEVDEEEEAVEEASEAAGEEGPESGGEEEATEDVAGASAAEAEKTSEKTRVDEEMKGLPDEVRPLVAAMKRNEPVEGRVFGWNKGGFHVVIDGVAGFCPRSEMDPEIAKDPDSVMDEELEFRIIRIEDAGRRVVLSRTAQKRHQARTTMQKIETGARVMGTVTNLTDFGAFVDIGGVEGLVHVSEIAHHRVEHPSDVLHEGDQVEVKILKIEKGGRRISLSMKALLPDPWKGVEERYQPGSTVTGTVERTAKVGSFIELEPGVTGLLPASEMGLPREAIPARVYHPGKEVELIVMSVDPRRKRISLAPEGSRAGGSRRDFMDYKEKQGEVTSGGFNALAEALQKISKDE